MMGHDISKQQFGSLTATEYRGAVRRGQDYLWRVTCTCGTSFECLLSDLMSGRYRSCAIKFARVCPSEIQAAQESLPTAMTGRYTDPDKAAMIRDLQARNSLYDVRPDGTYVPKAKGRR
jgi:hypothetical protein